VTGTATTATTVSGTVDTGAVGTVTGAVQTTTTASGTTTGTPLQSGSVTGAVQTTTTASGSVQALAPGATVGTAETTTTVGGTVSPTPLGSGAVTARATTQTTASGSVVGTTLTTGATTGRAQTTTVASGTTLGAVFDVDHLIGLVGVANNSYEIHGTMDGTEQLAYVPDDGRYVAGDSARITDTVYETEAQDTPKDISGASVRFGLALYEGAEPLVEKQVGDGVTIINGPNGELQVTIDPDDTSGLGRPDGKEYHFEIEVEDAQGDVHTVTAGEWTIYSNTV
jgi:hypothetical protein